MENPILKTIDDANPDKDWRIVERRTLKLCEEAGESAQAILSYTSPHNIKSKHLDDFLEEVADTVIVGLDILLTKYPGEENLSPEEIESKRLKIIHNKLEKWRGIRDRINSTSQ